MLSLAIFLHITDALRFHHLNCVNVSLGGLADFSDHSTFLLNLLFLNIVKDGWRCKELTLQACKSFFQLFMVLSTVGLRTRVTQGLLAVMTSSLFYRRRSSLHKGFLIVSYISVYWKPRTSLTVVHISDSLWHSPSLGCLHMTCTAEWPQLRTWGRWSFRLRTLLQKWALHDDYRIAARSLGLFWK